MSKANELRELFQKEGIIRIVGAHDGLTAKLVERAGFDGVWASGLEVSASHGVPDANILTMTQCLEVATIMNDAVTIPVVADCDTGFGNSNNVIFMVRKYEAAGIAAVTIEDKLFPKVNSYIPGRQELAPMAEFVGKVLAAKNAQQTEDFMVIARTEALIAGWGQEEALKRAHAYVGAGADAIVIHSKSNVPDEIVGFANAWDNRAPLIIIPTSYPVLTSEELEKLGIKMVIYANQGLRASIKAISEVLAEIRRTGRLDTVNDRIVPMSEVFDLQGMTQMKEGEKLYLRSGEEPIGVIMPAAGAPHNQESLEPLLGDIPLAMLDINGKSLLQRNLETLNKCKLYDVSVIRGYNKEAFTVEGVTYLDNPKYQSEHIVTSIMTAEAAMTGKTLIIYSDILFEGSLIERLKSLNSDVLIVIDNSFRMTAGRNRKLDLVIVKEKLASGHRILTYDHLYQVERLRAVVPSEEDAEFIAEFIGIAMLSKKGSEIFRREYRRALSAYEDKPIGEADNIFQASLTDFLQHLIDLGCKVEALLVNSGWMEIHTFDNYKHACSLVK